VSCRRARSVFSYSVVSLSLSLSLFPSVSFFPVFQTRARLVPSFIFTIPASLANRSTATVSGRPRGIPNRLSLLRQSGQGGCGISFARDASGLSPLYPWRAARRAAPRCSVSSFLIDSARQSRLSDLLGRSTRWFRRDEGWVAAENRGCEAVRERGGFYWAWRNADGIPSAVAAV